MAKIRYDGATAGANVLVAYGHDNLGRRISLTRGNGTSSIYAYDAVSRLASLAHDLGGNATNQDLTLGFAYNPAGQIVSTTRSNDAYAWTAHGNGTLSTVADGLNRIATWNGTLGYDTKGNLTSDGTSGFSYSSENLLTGIAVPPYAPGTFGYDPLMRFTSTSDGQRFLKFQDEMIAEYYNGALIQRFIPGERTDETVGSLSGSGTRSWYYADERGSTVARARDAGVATFLHSYDEYGRPAGNAPRIGFTGQLMVSFGQLYDYKNRFYHAGLGRFLQPDPIGYGGGMNMYGYVGGDPVNFTDPSGTIDCGLESNWRSGNCADNAVAHQVRTIGESNGYSGSEIRATTIRVLDYLYERADYATTALALLQLEAGVDARQGSRGCPGRFQCEDTPTDKMRNELIQLFGNSTFQASVRYSEQQSHRTGNEWGFTGNGRGSFSLVGGFIQGSGDAINARLIAERVAMGADLFFHIHPNLDRYHFPGLSSGRSHPLLGGDLGVAYHNGILVGAFAFKTRLFYWFDGKGLKR